MDTKEQVQQLIGEYSGKVMRENPKWAFRADDAALLAEQICQVFDAENAQLRKQLQDEQIDHRQTIDWYSDELAEAKAKVEKLQKFIADLGPLHIPIKIENKTDTAIVEEAWEAAEIQDNNGKVLPFPCDLKAGEIYRFVSKWKEEKET